MPSIKDLVSKAVTDNPPKEAEPSVAEPSAAVEAESSPAVETVEAPLDTDREAPAPKEETLESNWNEVVDELFKNLPMLYYTLKKTMPTYENDVLTVEVANGIQEEELSQRKRAVLEYWRSHFKMNVDDFEIVVNENKVTETAVLTSDEQFQRMKEQNPELLEFLDVLKFRMKY